LIYYGSGNPSTWNPVQRPGDNKWSMSLWARDADTGEVKWVYQMTPHDEWDFDGINETVLVDQEVKGKMHKTIVHFDRNGFGYTLDRETGELLVAREIRQISQLGNSRRYEHRSSTSCIQIQYRTKR
jgi:glucose dehydrogenase